MKTKPAALTVTANEIDYKFRHPRGRDLVVIERALKNGATEMEAMSELMGSLSEDELSADDFLDLPVAEFKALSVELSTFFRPVVG